jgi:alpha-glucosidase
MIVKKSVFEKVSLFRSGEPFKTGAVIADIPENNENYQSVDHFEAHAENGKTTLKYSFSDGDKMFGLGQCLGSMNRRGRRYRLYAADDPNHTPEKESLYGSHPFAIISGAETFGFFIDYPSEIFIDAGFTDRNTLEITISSEDFDLYIFGSPDMDEIIRNYLRLCGRPWVPPEWAFGYQQCRWSYPDQRSVEEVARNFKKHEIPCSAIYLDIDYMKDYKVFTVDKEKFPDISGLSAELKELGIRLVAIIDPGVRIEKGYDVYEEGVERGFFCRDKNGGYFTAAVWPGLTHFPDFLNPETRRWWGALYERLVRSGIEGFWNDMNEPSIFYTPEKLSEALEFAAGASKDPEPGRLLFDAREKFNKLANAREYHSFFYHEPEAGCSVPHEKVHNLFGYNMSLAASEGLEALRPGRRHFLLSRSSFAGMHRFSAVWTGDNSSWWEHLGVHMRMVMSLNMAGFFYCGADVGGFSCDASADLVIRWTQLGALTPLFRNHSALGTRHQEPWAFDDHTTGIIKNIIRLRYALIPYLYSEFIRSANELTPFISPLFLKFGDAVSAETEDQFMAGGSLMAAPVHIQNATGRHVYLPESRWLYWPASSPDIREMAVMEPGAHYISAQLDETPIFIAENSMIALNLTDGVGNSEAGQNNLLVIAFVTKKASFVYYEDDGETLAFEKGTFSKLNIEIHNHKGVYDIKTAANVSPLCPLKVKAVYFEIYDETGRMTEIKAAL